MMQQHNMVRSQRLFVGIDVLLILLAAAFCFCAWSASQLTIVRSAYRAQVSIDSATETSATWRSVSPQYPLDLPMDLRQAEILTQFQLKLIHPVLLQFRADDCVESITVNSIAIGEHALPYCHHLRDKMLFANGALQRGNNIVVGTVSNHAGTMNLQFSIPWYDPVRLSFVLLSLSCLAIVSRRILLRVGSKTTNQLHTHMALVLGGGVLIRALYLAATSFLARGHDVWGHIEYTEYMAEHWSIPLARDGWQFYHPPLYYMLTAAWYALGKLLGRTSYMLYGDMQVISFFLSIATLCIAVLWIGKMLFQHKDEQKQHLLYAGVLAVFPSFVFFAARINNDVLLLLWQVLAIGFLLRWWQSKKKPLYDWFFCIIFLALGTLTKSTALLLLPIPFVCLGLTRVFPRKKMLATAALGLAVFVALTGWHAALRFGVERHTSVVANITHLNQSLRVDHSLASITTLSPLRILQDPYNDPFDDTSGRNWFWEYLFRSAFFGEFHFGSGLHFISSMLLLCALLLLPAVAIGVRQGLRSLQSVDLPMFLVLLCSLAGHMLYRQTAPFSSSQDFRYSMIALLPIAYFLVRGIFVSPKIVRQGWLGVLYIAFGLSTLFLVSIGPG